MPHSFNSGSGDPVNVGEVFGLSRGVEKVVSEEEQKDLYDFSIMLHNGVMMASF